MSMRHPFRTLVLALILIVAMSVARRYMESDAQTSPSLDDITVPAARVARETSPETSEPLTIVEPNENWMEDVGASEHVDAEIPANEADRYLPPPGVRR
jgi:hypothetical protein